MCVFVCVRVVIVLRNNIFSSICECVDMGAKRESGGGGGLRLDISPIDH